MRYLLIVVVLMSGFFPTIGSADAVEERRLTISASIFPKIIALDQQLTAKMGPDGHIHLGVVYLRNEDRAKSIAQNIRNKVKKLTGITVQIESTSLSQALKNHNKRYAGLLLSEKLFDKDLIDIITLSSEKKILLFSPFDGDIEKGVSSSIFVGAKIRPYFNLSALKKAKIELRPSILKVSKTYE